MTWPHAALGEICQVVGGATPRTDRPEFWGGDILWATPKDLSAHAGRSIESTARTLTPEGLSSCGAQVLPAGSVLLSSRAPIGLVAVNAAPMATNQGFKSLVPNRARVDPSYLAFWLSVHTDYLQALGTGATFKEISKAVVSRIEVPLPPLDKQRWIARALDSADSLRRSVTAQLNRLRDLKQAVVQPCLGGQAEVRVPLTDVLAAPLGNGISPATAGTYPGTVLTLTAVRDGVFDGSARKACVFERPPQPRQMVSAGTFLVSRGNGNLALVGRGAVVREDLPGVAYPDTMIGASIDPTRLMPEFLEVVWGMPAIRRQIERSATTTNGTYKINQQKLGAVTIPVPPLARQERVAEQLRCIDGQVVLGAERRAKVDALFQSLQHCAFTGAL